MVPPPVHAYRPDEGDQGPAECVSGAERVHGRALHGGARGLSVQRPLSLQKDDATAKKIGEAYLAHLDTMLEFFEGLSRDTFGREIAQILLIHVNDINADYLPAMLDKMKGRGYAFVSLAEAMKDAAYRTRDDYIGNAGPSWLHRWRAARGLPSQLTAEPDPPTWVIDLYRQR